MFENAEKFRTIIVKLNLDTNNQYTLNIDGNQVTSEESIKLPCININNIIFR